MLLHPIVIFFSVWVVGIVFYLLRITHWAPNRPYLLILIFCVSGLLFVVGYLVGASFRKRRSVSLGASDMVVNIRRLRIFQCVLTTISLAIITYNFVAIGAPPAFYRIAGIDTPYYLVYGRLKGLLFPALGAIFLTTFFDKSRTFRILFRVFPIAVLGCYISREMLAATFLQGFFLYAITRKLRDGKIVLGSLVILGCVLVMMYVVGELRTGKEELLDAMEIRGPYRSLNMGLLWGISYISLPFANLLSFIENADVHLFGRVVLDRMLPSFLALGGYEDYFRSLLPNTNNNVATYLGYVYLDFGGAGIIGINLLLGTLGGLLYRPDRSYHYSMTYAIYLSVIALLFFQDYLLHLPFLVNFALSIIVTRGCMSVSPPGIDPTRPPQEKVRI